MFSASDTHNNALFGVVCSIGTERKDTRRIDSQGGVCYCGGGKEGYVMFFPMLMMTIEILLMSQGFYSGSSAFQFVSSGKLGWVTSERLNCVNWPLLVFKA